MSDHSPVVVADQRVTRSSAVGTEKGRPWSLVGTRVQCFKRNLAYCELSINVVAVIIGNKSPENHLP